MSDRDNVTTLMSIALCPECGRHAHFLCGGEQISGEFFSQGQAEELAVDFREDGDISWQEFAQLMYQIQHSGLPMAIPHEMEYLLHLDLELRILEGTFPDAVAEGGEDEIDNLHDLLTTFFPEAPMTLQ
jgi:hypothetical protein